MYFQNEKELKTFQMFKNRTNRHKMANLYSRKDFTLRHSLWEKKQKLAQNDHIWLVVNFMKVFYRATSCPRQSLLSGSKSGFLIQV